MLTRDQTNILNLIDILESIVMCLCTSAEGVPQRLEQARMEILKLSRQDYLPQSFAEKLRRIDRDISLWTSSSKQEKAVLDSIVLEIVRLYASSPSEIRKWNRERKG
jgi:hypothetical protein